MIGVLTAGGICGAGRAFAKEEAKAVEFGGKEEAAAKAADPAGPASDEKLCFLDPKVVDKAFDNYVGKHIAAAVGGNKLAVEKIPVMDDALDEFGKVSPVGFETGMTLASKYVWRGQNLGSRACLQPYAKAATKFLPLGTFSFTWWGNYMPDGVSEGTTVDTEHDLTWDYNFDFLALLKLGGIDASGWPCPLGKLLDLNYATGFIYYDFPPSKSYSREYYNIITMSWPLHPYIGLYNDFGAGNGIWIDMGISQPWDLKLFTVNSYLKFGYNKNQWCRSSKLQTMEYGFSLPIPIGKHIKIEPFLSHSVRLNKTYFYTQVDDGNGNTVEQGNVLTQNEFFGGFKYSINF